MTVTVVWFEETGERRDIVRRCKVCFSPPDLDHPGFGVVSPAGIEHWGVDYGMTYCGKDATGDAWWWPL